MERLVSTLELAENWRNSLQRTCKQNHLAVSMAMSFSPNRFRIAYRRFVEAHSKNNELDKWMQNQLKAYYWITLVLSYTQELKISQFKDEHWQILFSIFYFKRPSALKYEIKILILKAGQHSHWSPEEQSIYLDIMQTSSNKANKWSEKALELFERSHHKYLRTGKQCRQKWVNNLDPANNRSEWTEAEDRELAALVLNRGRKWSVLARAMTTNRTENMVKKHYTAFLRNLKKQYPLIEDEDDLLRQFIREGNNAQQASLGISALEENNDEKLQEDHFLPEIPQNTSTNEQQLDKEKLVLQEIGNSLLILKQDLYKLPIEISALDGVLPSPLPLNNPNTPTLSPIHHYYLNLNVFSSFEQDVGDSFYDIRKSSD